MSNHMNEFKPSFSSLEFAAKTMRQLDQLSNERQAWQDNEYKNSTTRLYNLLAAVYSVYESKFINSNGDDRRTLRQQLVGKLNANQIGVKKSTDTLGLLIRYVFNSDRRRVMSYKYAILAAYSNDVASTDLAQWLCDQGGVDQVSRKVSYSQETIDRREEVLKATNSVEQLIAQRTDAPLGTVTLPINAFSARVVMLAEPCGEGKFKILYVFDDPSDGVQKSLIRKAAAKTAEVQIEVNAANKEVTSFINFKRLTKSHDMAVA
jgi:hypothetical protein